MFIVATGCSHPRALAARSAANMCLDVVDGGDVAALTGSTWPTDGAAGSAIADAGAATGAGGAAGCGGDALTAVVVCADGVVVVVFASVPDLSGVIGCVGCAIVFGSPEQSIATLINVG